VPGSCVADVDAELEKTPSDIMRLLETASDAGVELEVLMKRGLFYCPKPKASYVL